MEEGTHDGSSSLSTGLELESPNVFMRLFLVRFTRGGKPTLNVSDIILQNGYKGEESWALASVALLPDCRCSMTSRLTRLLSCLPCHQNPKTNFPLTGFLSGALLQQ